ncbi:hypothetical protein [Longispora albida]|uniref:hypothetical protein n=1 Tax=Longispora albida TaxID=203523 RepID=UPI0003A4A336|nr:hypothetical protein [Longispora albida]
MNNEPTVVSGLQLTGVGRKSRFGTWWVARGPAGLRGALLLDPALSRGAALDRVVAQVVAVRGLAVTGVLPVADLVTEGGRVWLITSEPASPTVAELLSKPNRDGDDAIAVALWTGQTLHGLHTGGLVHGDFGPHNIVLTGSGAAALIEVGLASGDVESDVRAWAALLLVLAERWGDPGLTRAATIAKVSGLAAALDALAGTATVALPPQVPAQPVVPVVQPVVPQPVPQQQPKVAESTVLLGGYEPTAQLGSSQGEQTRPGAMNTAAGGTGDDVRLRFGTGVPAAVEQAWKGGPPQPPKKKRRLGKIISGAITGALIGGVVAYFLWFNSHPLHVSGARVAPATPPGEACEITVDVVGTITTNGRPGTITYRWLRSDGKETEELRQRVADGQKSVDVHLHWKFSGQGSYKATATLKVTGPDAQAATGEFTYSCKGTT